MAETRTETQVRMVLETQCREAADLLKANTPAGTVFCLVLADVGERGNVAYVSTCERDSAENMLYELLEKWAKDRPWTITRADCPCCHACLSPGEDTDRALVVAFLSGLAAKDAGLTRSPMSRTLCLKHARMSAEAAAFLLALGAPPETS